MRILKILLLSTALAAFGAGTALAAPPQLAAVPGDTGKVKTTKKKVSKKKVVKKKVAHKTKKGVKKKYTVAKAPKKKPTDTERAPGDPPPGTQPQ